MNEAKQINTNHTAIDLSLVSGKYQLTVIQRADLFQKISEGKLVKELLDEYQISETAFRYLLHNEYINFNEHRPYTDLEIIFGQRSAVAPRQKAEFPLYTEDKKNNFEYLLKKHDGLIRWAINYSGFIPPDGDMNEIMQVIRCVLYYRYSYFDSSKVSFTSWMAMTAYYTVLNFRKRKSRDPMRLKESCDFLDTYNSTETQADEVKENPALKSLSLAINQLPANYRKILLLHLDGVSNEAICTAVGIKQKRLYNILYLVKASIYEYRDRWFQKGIATGKGWLTPSELSGKKNLFDLIQTKTKRVTLEEQRQIKLKLESLSIKEVSVMMGKPESAIRSVSKKYKLRRVQPSFQPKVYNNNLISSVRKEINLLGSIQATAEKLGMNRKTIKKIVETAGISLPAQKRRTA